MEVVRGLVVVQVHRMKLGALRLQGWTPRSKSALLALTICHSGEMTRVLQ